MKNFCFLFYSNETYLPILDLTLGEFNYYFNNNPFKKYVVSNKFTDNAFSMVCEKCLPCPSKSTFEFKNVAFLFVKM